MFVNINDFLLNDNLNGFSTICYLILLKLTLIWILIIFVFYEKLIAIILSICLNSKLNRIHFSTNGISVSFIWLRVHLKDVCISCQDLYYFKCDDLIIELNKYSSKLNLLNDRLILVKLKRVSMTLIETNSNSFTKFVKFYEKCLFDFENFNLTIYNSSQNYLINIEIDNFLFTTINLKLFQINRLVMKLNKSKVIELKRTQIKLKETLSVFSDYIRVDFNIWSSELIDFFKSSQFLDNLKLDLHKKFKFNQIDLMLKHHEDILFGLTAHNISLINFDLNYFKLDLKEFNAHVFANNSPILEGQYLNLEYNNFFNITIKILKLNVQNLIQILNLILLVKEKLTDLIQIESECNFLIKNFELLIEYFRLESKKVRVKFFQNNKILITFDLNSFLTNDSDTSIFYCEKICFESIINKSGTRFQILISPLLYGEAEQMNFNSDNLIAFNLLFVSVIQIRYHSFHSNLKTYFKQIEITFGDVFGSLDLAHLQQLIHQYDVLNQLILKEFLVKSSLINSYLNSQSYMAIKLLTSLIHVNLIDLTAQVDNKINSFGFNFTLSPLNCGKCDMHSSNYYFNLTPKMSFKIVGSIERLTWNDLLNLIQFGSINFNFSNLSSTPTRTISENFIENLKKSDDENRFLKFLWNNENECACGGNLEFFSFDTFEFYKLTSNAVYKPSINFLNTKNNNKYGFGQSILVPSEMCFYSYMKIFKNLPKLNSKALNCKVLSFIETNNVSKKRFEPYEIGIYTDYKISTFLNDYIDINDIKTQSFEILTSNFNSANMSPPYFSNDFSIYIRYLPGVSDKSYSDILDYNITDNLLKKLDLFDTKLLKDSKIFLNLTESNHSLPRIESNLSITNVSLNEEKISLESKSNHDSNDSSGLDKEKEFSYLPQFTYNLKQINTGFKLTNSGDTSSTSQKIIIQHLQLESMIKLNDSKSLYLDENEEMFLDCFMTPFGLQCLSLISLHDTNLTKLLVKLNEIDKIKLKLLYQNEFISLDASKLVIDAEKSLIKLVDLIMVKRNALVEIRNEETLLSNKCFSLTEWFDAFYAPFNTIFIRLTRLKLTLQISNLIVLNMHKSIDKLLLPELEMFFSNSINTQNKNKFNRTYVAKLEIKELIFTDSISIGDLFDCFTNLIRYMFPQSELELDHAKHSMNTSTFKLVIKRFAYKVKLFNLNYINFDSNQFELTYSNDILRLKQFVFEFKLDLKFDLIVIPSSREEFNLINGNLFLDQTLLDTNIQGEFLINSLENEPVKIYFTFTLPLPLETRVKLDKNKLNIHLVGLLGYLSHTNKELIYQLIEMNSICLNIDFSSIELECDRLRLMRSSTKSIDVFNLLQSHLFVDSVESNTYSYRFNSKQTLISYFMNDFKSNKKWLLIKLENVKFEYDLIKKTSTNKDERALLNISTNEIVETNNNKIFNLNELSLKKSNLCLFISSSSKVMNEFNFKKWLDFVSLSQLDAFNYHIQLIGKVACLNLEFYFREEFNWNLKIRRSEKLFLNAALFEPIYTQLMANFSFSIVENYKQQQELDEFILNDFNGSQLVADKDLNYLDKNQFVCLIHRFLLLKYKNMLLLIGLIKRNNNNNTNATQNIEK